MCFDTYLTNPVRCSINALNEVYTCLGNIVTAEELRVVTNMSKFNLSTIIATPQ